MSQFIYLLNAFEAAAQSPTPYEAKYAEKRKALLDYVAALEKPIPSEMRPIAAPTDEEVAAYRDLFRSELDKNMHNSSSSPSTDAHRVALHRFVEARNGKRTVR